MTIPRLELTAATVSVQAAAMSKELDEQVESEIYCTNSTSVLQHIRGEKKLFHLFVAKWLQRIKERTSPTQ